MSQIAPFSEMEQPSIGYSSPIMSGERAIWFEVIKLTLWDYAHLRREQLRGYHMMARRREALKVLHTSIFTDDGSMADIAHAVATDPGYVLDSIREAVSDEQILSGWVLGRKMREDKPHTPGKWDQIMKR